jgi:lipoprotein-anchoring transpeptidase ErfK/SrfK
VSRARVVVRKSDFMLELVTGAGTERFRVGIGSNPDGGDKKAVGDCRTPEGTFAIVSIEDSSDWERDGRLSYGPLFLRLECPPWEGIGIHGTDEPESVGRRSSLGCIRMRNEELRKLAAAVRVGTEVTILP